MNYEGTNWEGRTYECPTSIRSLGNQVDAEYPDRPRGTDGTVASKTHDLGPPPNPNSEHRPTPHTGHGIVRAIDVTVTPEQGDRITAALRLSQDPRIKYVIWNRRKFKPPTWKWRQYNGTNPHEKHFHVSTEIAGDDDDSPWSLGGDMPLDDEAKQFITETVRAELEAALGPERTWTSADGRDRRGYKTMIDSAWWPKAGEDMATLDILKAAARPPDLDEAAFAQAVVAALPPSLAEAIANEVARQLADNQ